MSELMSRLKKATKTKDADVLSESKFFNEKDMVPTKIPAINIALSANLNGGFVPGLTMWAGPSKHFKTLFSLIMAKAYLDKYPEGVLLFYDTEFGTPQGYFSAVGIDLDRVFHVPVTNVEELKFETSQAIEEIKREDKVIIVVDSIGNVASKKEVDDALDGKSVADMTRAKQLKSYFRIATPQLTTKDIPMVVVNHTYKEIGLYPKDIVSGGTGSYYSADNIFIIGRQQDKEGTEIVGYNFIIKVEKSRYVREGSKIPITVSFEGGISKYSGLMDIAVDSGHVVKPKMGWYAGVNQETGEIDDKNWRLKQTFTEEFWKPILECPKFSEYIMKRYGVSHGALIHEEDSAEEVFDRVVEEE